MQVRHCVFCPEGLPNERGTVGEVKLLGMTGTVTVDETTRTYQFWCDISDKERQLTREQLDAADAIVDARLERYTQDVDDDGQFDLEAEQVDVDAAISWACGIVNRSTINVLSGWTPSLHQQFLRALGVRGALFRVASCECLQQEIQRQAAAQATAVAGSV